MDRRRFDSVQALRAIAALCVVVCHIEGSIGGQFGVDIFMCITGFMIAYTTENQNNAGKFLKNRAIRILPLYYSITLLTFICAQIMPSMFRTTVATAPNLIKSFLFIPYEARGGHILPVFPIGWTINYEIGFYVLTAFMMKFFPKYKIAAMNIVLVLLTAAGVLFEPQNPILRFWTSNILLEYCFGMLVYEAAKRFWDKAKDKPEQNRFARSGAGMTAIIILLAGMFAADYYPLPVVRSVKWGIPAAVMLAVCILTLHDNDLFAQGVGHFLVVIGNASYSLYLTHYFVVKGCDRALHIGDKNFAGRAIIAVLISLAVAFIVYQIFEKNSIRFFDEKTNKRGNESK